MSTISMLTPASLLRRCARGVLGASGVLALASQTGCGSLEPITPSQPITEPTQLYMRLTVDYPAAVLSTAPGYDAVQLTATPRDARGNAIVGLPAPVFIVPRGVDTTKVAVTPDGLVSALAGMASSDTPIPVIASLTVGPVRHEDTTFVIVRDLVPPPQLASFSIQPTTTDSATWGMSYQSGALGVLVDVGEFRGAGDIGSLLAFLLGLGPSLEGQRFLRPRAQDQNGVMIPASELLVEYRSLDPTIAEVDRRSGAVKLRRLGQARMVARTMVYGITKADTLLITVTWPAFATIPIFVIDSGPAFRPTEIKIRPNGIVFWASTVDETVDVTFDDPAQVVTPSAALCDHPFMMAIGVVSLCGAGNTTVPPYVHDPFNPEPLLLLLATARARQFPVPGVYSYRSTQTGASGRIIVSWE